MMSDKPLLSCSYRWEHPRGRKRYVDWVGHCRRTTAASCGRCTAHCLGGVGLHRAEHQARRASDEHQAPSKESE